jgi:predicted permease
MEALMPVIRNLTDWFRGLFSKKSVRQEFGEEVRPGNWGTILETTWGDFRFGLRMLRKNIGFTTAAVLTLALGIGVNAAIFSMVDGLFLRPLPLKNPQQIVSFASQRQRGWSNGYSYPEFEDIRSQTTDMFSTVAGYQIGQDGLTTNGKTEPIQSAYVPGDFFTMLGVQPYLGRFILPSEGKAAGADPVIVLSYSYWKRRFGGDPGVIGKSVALNGHPVTIIGVAPERFLGIATFFETQGYLPSGVASYATDATPDFMTNRENPRLILLARLREGVTVDHAQASLRVISERLAKQYPKTNEGTVIHAFQLRPPGPMGNPSATPITAITVLFLILAAFPLVLSCVNVANLLLVRAGARRQEMTIRAALGAARGRLVRQLLVESLLLAFFGCAGGILLGLGGSRALSSIPLQTDFPIVMDFHFDWRVFAYAAAAALVAGVLVGIVPALRASRNNLSAVLHEGGRTATGARHRFRNTMIAVQVGGSLMLLIVAGLFTRSLQSAQHRDLGFVADHVLNLTLNPSEIGYTKTQASAFYKELMERVRSAPGVESASLAIGLPMGDILFGEAIEVPGFRNPGGQKPPEPNYNAVSPGYFKTMGIALLAGRDFNEQDTQDSLHVAIISEAMAKLYWPGQNAIGQKFLRKSNPAHAVEVVGVAKNIRMANTLDLGDTMFYAPLTQNPSQSFASSQTLQVLTVGPPETMSREVTELVQSIAPAMPVLHVRTMRQALSGFNGLFLFEMGAGVAAALGFLGLILAVVGVYGVVSYAASQRTQEIGIRMALGAQPGQILRMIFRQGLTIIAVGVALGLLGAAGMSRLVSGLLVGVGGTDPLTYFGASLVLAMVAMAACYIPARRATKVDPMIALHYE